MTPDPPRQERMSREEVSGVRPWDLLRAATSPRFPGGPAERVLFLALWRHADFEGVCWPSVALLARESGLSRRRAGIALARLVEAGLVTVQSLRGRSHLFELDIERVIDLAAQGESPKPAHSVRGSPEPVVEGESPKPAHGVRGSEALPEGGKPDSGSTEPDPRTDCTDLRTDCSSPAHGLLITRAQRAHEVALGSSPRSDSPEVRVDGSAVPSVTDAGEPVIPTDTDNGNGTPPLPTREEIAAEITVRAAALGEEDAKALQRIVRSYLKTGSGITAHLALSKLAKRAGMPRASLGPDAGVLAAARSGGAA